MAIKAIIEPSPIGTYMRQMTYPRKDNMVIQRNGRAAGVDILSCYVNDGKIKPLLIFFHGLLQGRESNMQLIYELANEGFYVAVPAMIEPRIKSARNNMMPLELLKTVVSETRAMIRSLQRHPFIDDEWVGMLGMAFGGVAVYKYLSLGESGLQAVAVINSTPDLPAVIHSPMGFLSGKMILGQMPITPPPEKKHQRTVTGAGAYSPLKFWAGMKGVPLLIQHGLDDPLCAIAGDEQLYQLLAPEASDEDLVAYFYKNVGRDLDRQMTDHLVEWFKGHL